MTVFSYRNMHVIYGQKIYTPAHAHAHTNTHIHKYTRLWIDDDRVKISNGLHGNQRSVNVSARTVRGIKPPDRYNNNISNTWRCYSHQR